MDRLNMLYTSNNEQDLIKFYNSFNNKDELIIWLKQRRMQEHSIKIFNEDKPKDLVAVILTKDINSKFALRIRELFNDIPIIFNDTKSDIWNFAQSVNYAYKIAIKQFNPKWIIICNDDIAEAEPIQKLKQQLDKVVDKELVLVKHNHSNTIHFAKPSLIRKALMKMGKMDKEITEIYSKLNVEIMPIPNKRKIDILMYKSVSEKFENSSDFYIINRTFGVPYDDTFLNEAEDVDLSFRLKNNITQINYTIKCIGGGKFGNR